MNGFSKQKKSVVSFDGAKVDVRIKWNDFIFIDY